MPVTNKVCEMTPINTLPPLEKMEETALYQKNFERIEKNEILINTLFRQEFSCESAIQLTLRKIKSCLDIAQYNVCGFARGF